jgi:APA family basic amino acid/polyamine antiporter
VALARDGLFPERLARLHPRFGTPATAIAVQATLATLLVMVSSFAVIVAYFLFVTVAFIALSAAGLYRFPPPAEGFRTPLRAVTPAVFASLSALLLLMLLAGRPLQALLGTGIVLLGLPVYALLHRRGVLRAQP